MIMKLSQSELKAVLEYTPESGGFFWKESRGRVAKGQRAGHTSAGSKGYLWIGVDRRLYRAHRLAWLYMNGEWPKAQLDHKNGDRSDNRWENLRAATPAQNNANMKARSNCTSKYKGVKWNKQCSQWQAAIRVAGKVTHLGLFDDEERAHQAYIRAAQVAFGEFARSS